MRNTAAHIPTPEEALSTLNTLAKTQNAQDNDDNPIEYEELIVNIAYAYLSAHDMT